LGIGLRCKKIYKNGIYVKRLLFKKYGKWLFLALNWVKMFDVHGKIFLIVMAICKMDICVIWISNGII